MLYDNSPKFTLKPRFSSKAFNKAANGSASFHDQLPPLMYHPRLLGHLLGFCTSTVQDHPHVCSPCLNMDSGSSAMHPRTTLSVTGLLVLICIDHPILYFRTSPVQSNTPCYKRNCRHDKCKSIDWQWPGCPCYTDICGIAAQFKVYLFHILQYPVHAIASAKFWSPHIRKHSSISKLSVVLLTSHPASAAWIASR